MQKLIRADDFYLRASYQCVQYFETGNFSGIPDAVFINGACRDQKDLVFDLSELNGARILSATFVATLGSALYTPEESTVNGQWVSFGETCNVPIAVAEDAQEVTVRAVYKCIPVLHTNHDDVRHEHEGVLAYVDVGLLVEYLSAAELKAYTDPNPVAGETYVRAVHLTELHTNVNQVRRAYGLEDFAFTPIVPWGTWLAVWESHVLEIRDAIDEISAEHETWLALNDAGPSLSVLLQLRRVVAAVVPN